MTVTETYERIRETITFARDSKLDGVPIRVTLAAEKYDVSHATLQRWAKKGLIKVLRRGPKLLELDEADVKRASQIFHKAVEYVPKRKASWILKRALQASQTGE